MYVGRSWSYQPNLEAGSDPAVSWAATGLPAGMAINTTSGLISGIPTEPGVFVINLTATNASGTSLVMVFPMGVSFSPLSYDGAVLMNVFLQSGAVVRPGTSQSPLLFAKSDDKLVVAIGFVDDAGVLQEIGAVNAINVTFKAYDDEQKVVLTTGNFFAVGDYESRRYLVVLDFTSPIIKAALSDWEDPRGTGIVALGEIEWTWVWVPPASVATEELTRSSWNFGITTYKQLKD
jgi:hypothetical protein